MSNETSDIVIETPAAAEVAEVAEVAIVKELPFSFAKRHGVLIRGIKDGVADAVYRDKVTPLSLAEVRRFIGMPITLSRVGIDEFDALLQQAYEHGSHKAMHMVEGLDDDTNLLRVAQELPEPSDLLESDDDAPIIRFINAVLTEAVKDNASDVHIEPDRKSVV